MNKPKVSVVMPVYNAAQFLSASMQSISKQTFKDFELIIVDDGSTDDSMKVVSSYADLRIRVIEHERNQGLSAARNSGLRSAQGEFIAWLDADDISHPQRIADQVKLMDARPEVAICGTWVETIGENPGLRWRYPISDGRLKARVLFDDPFATSSVMLRKRALAENGLSFNAEYPPAEDYDLWERILRISGGANIPRYLTFYRVHEAQTSINGAAKQRESVWRIQERQLLRLGIVPTSKERELHTKLGSYEYVRSDEFIKDTQRWLERLGDANTEKGVFPKKAFNYVLCTKWAEVCAAGNASRISALKWFQSSSLTGRMKLLDRQRLYMILRCILGPIAKLMRYTAPKRRRTIRTSHLN